MTEIARKKFEILNYTQSDEFNIDGLAEKLNELTTIAKAVNEDGLLQHVRGCVCPNCVNERAFSNKLGWCFCHDCGHEWQI
jgi:hypothetical protein